jgi:hypothetical protein
MDKNQEVSDLKLNLFGNPQNDVENYVYCRRVKDYLLLQRQQSGKDIKDIAAASGYTKLDKFKTHLNEWQELERPIPKKYLQAINADIDTLLSLSELDKSDYEEAIKIPRKASFCTVRLIPGIYATYSFGRMVSEEEAIKLAKDYSQNKKQICIINFPGLFLIDIHPDGKVSKSYYYPNVDITKEWVKFGWNGSNLGSTRIK